MYEYYNCHLSDDSKYEKSLLTSFHPSKRIRPNMICVKSLMCKVQQTVFIFNIYYADVDFLFLLDL